MKVAFVVISLLGVMPGVLLLSLLMRRQISEEEIQKLSARDRGLEPSATWNMKTTGRIEVSEILVSLNVCGVSIPVAPLVSRTHSVLAVMLISSAVFFTVGFAYLLFRTYSVP